METKLIGNDREHNEVMARVGAGILALMDARPGTPLADEIGRLASLIEKHEEEGPCDRHTTFCQTCGHPLTLTGGYLMVAKCGGCENTIRVGSSIQTPHRSASDGTPTKPELPPNRETRDGSPVYGVPTKPEPLEPESKK